MASDLAANGYEAEMRLRNRGHALFDPHPGYRDDAMSELNPPVDIGDVGFVSRGSFHLLFNIHRPANDSLQIHGVPDGFEMVELNMRHVDRRGGDIQRVIVSSRRDVSMNVQVAASA